MIQNIIVASLFLIACWFVGRMIYSNLRPKDNAACNGCAAAKHLSKNTELNS